MSNQYLVYDLDVDCYDISQLNWNINTYVYVTPADIYILCRPVFVAFQALVCYVDQSVLLSVQDSCKLY